PNIVNTVPTVLSTLLGTKNTTPTQPKPPSGNGGHHNGGGGTKPGKTKHSQTASATSASTRTSTTVKTTAVPAKRPSVVQPTPQTTSDHNSDSGSIGGVIGSLFSPVVDAAKTVVTLFGWNLLALIPMAGIAFVISRRMSAARRSASGLL